MGIIRVTIWVIGVINPTYYVPLTLQVGFRVYGFRVQGFGFRV